VTPAIELARLATLGFGYSVMITYLKHTITRLYPSGMYEAYIGGHFMRADTLAGIKATIREYGSASL
jgi:hypothetical protein